MTTVYDPATGKPVDLDTPDAEKQILSGAVALKKSDSFNLVDNQGKWRGSVPADKLTSYLSTGGYHLTTPEQRQTIQKISDNMGTAGALKVFGEKALDELSLGATRPIFKAFRSPEEQAAQEQIEASHPVASMAGTGAGFAGSLVAGEPLFKGAAKLGGLAERGIAGATEGLGMTPGFGSKLLGSAAKYGVESAAIAAPEAITEATFGDPNEAAEHLAYALGAGLALGSVAPVMKGAGKILGNIVGKPFGIDFNAENPLKKMTDDQTIRAGIYGTDKYARELVNNIGDEKMADFLHNNGLVRQPGEDFAQYLPRVQAYKQQIGSEIGAAYDQIVGVGSNPAEDIVGRINKEVIDPLRRVGAKRGEVRALDNYVQDFKDAIDYINKDKMGMAQAKVEGLGFKPTEPGGEPPPFDPNRTITDRYPAGMDADPNKTLHDLPPFQELRDTARDVPFQGGTTQKGGMPEFQDELSKTRDERRKLVDEEVQQKGTVKEGKSPIGTVTDENRPNANDIPTQINENPHIFGKTGAPPEVIPPFENAVKEHGPNDVVSLGDLWKERQALDDRIYNEKRAVLGNPSPLHQQLQKVRGIIDSEIKSKAEEALGKEGKSFIDPINKLNEAYHNINVWEDVVERSHMSEASRRNISLSDYLGGIIAGAHNPLGFVGGIAAGLGHKYLRENGNAIIAKYGNNLALYIADKARQNSEEQFSKIPSVLRTMARAGSNAPVVGASQAGHIFDFFSGDKSKNEEDAFDNFSQKITAAINDPNQKAVEVANFLKQGAPNIGAAYQMQNTKMLNYLFSAMPKNPYATLPFQMNLWKPTKSQMRSFKDKLTIIQNPYTILSFVQKGTINKDHMDALKTIYPANYNTLVSKVKEFGYSNPKMPYQNKLKLSILLGEPLDSSIANVGSYQEAYGQEGEQPKPMAKEKLAKLPGAQYTDMQNIVG